MLKSVLKSVEGWAVLKSVEGWVMLSVLRAGQC